MLTLWSISIHYRVTGVSRCCPVYLLTVKKIIVGNFENVYPRLCSLVSSYLLLVSKQPEISTVLRIAYFAGFLMINRTECVLS